MRCSFKVAPRHFLSLAVGLITLVACAGGWLSSSTRGVASQALRVTTRLVVLNAVVHDKSGAPVAGLKRNDFTILDDGKKQQISIFSAQSNQSPQATARPLPPNVFSNLISRGGSAPTSATLILIDGVYTRFADQAYARSQLVKFLRELRPTDRVALCTVGTRLRVIQDFTNDPAPLIEALQHYSAQPAPTGGNAAPRQGPDAGSSAFAGPAEAAAARFNAGVLDMVRAGLQVFPPCTLTFAELEGIQAIAHRLSGLAGRKSLIWVTGGMPLPRKLPARIAAGAPNDAEWCGKPAVAQMALNTIRDLNQANIAIYPVDARGVFTDPYFSATNGTYAPPGGVLARLTAMFTPDLAMGYWASETGGRAFYNTNAIRGAIRDALDDSELTYTLGYYPNNARWNGEYRRIKVLVDRRGLRVRYRRGYYAAAESASGSTDPIALLSAVADSPLDSTGLGVTVRIKPLTLTVPARFEVTADIGPHGLTFRAENSRHNADFVVWAAQYSRKGGFLGATSRTVAGRLNEAQYRAALAGSVALRFQDTAKPGAWELRIAVRDAESGAVGSVRIPLHNILKPGS